MGCWNETCLLSNLPITEGQPVFGVLLSERTPASPYNDTQFDQAYLVSPPIAGHYNDYGAMEKITPTSITKILTEAFDESNIETLIKAAARDGVDVPPPYNTFKELGRVRLAMFHKSVWVAMRQTLYAHYLDQWRNEAFTAIKALKDMAEVQEALARLGRKKEAFTKADLKDLSKSVRSFGTFREIIWPPVIAQLPFKETLFPAIVQRDLNAELIKSHVETMAFITGLRHSRILLGRTGIHNQETFGPVQKVRLAAAHKLAQKIR